MNERETAEPLGLEPFATSEAMGLDEDRVRRRRELLSFDAEDMRLLATLAPLIRAHVDDLTTGFFEHLAQFGEAHGLLNNPAALDRARRLKRQHLLAMVEGPYGRRYAEERVQLALVYGEAGLHHHAFLGAFHHLMSQISQRVLSQYGDDALEILPALDALQKVALLDIGLVLDVFAFQRERIIAQQQQAIRALSTPVLKLRDNLLLLPVVGMVDAERAGQLTEHLLQAIPANRAKVAVIDITGAASVDAPAANELVRVITKARMMGSDIIVTGVSAQMAIRLVELGLDLRRVRAVGDLQGGIEQAELLLGVGQTTRRVPSAVEQTPEPSPTPLPPDDLIAPVPTETSSIPSATVRQVTLRPTRS
jgi:rsbT co-antagonist protein RsbR